MKFHHHPSAPHVVCTGIDSCYVFISSSRELTESIAKAGKSALMDHPTGAWSQAWRIRVDPPDMDTDKYSIAVEIPADWQSLDRGMLSSLAAFQRHLREKLAELHLDIDTDEPPSFWGGCWLGWAITPTAAAATRAIHAARLADYEELRAGAATDTHIGQVWSDTEDPAIEHQLTSHVRRCEDLLASARHLAAWQDENRTEEPLPWMAAENEGKLDADGKVIVTISVADQAEGHAKLARQVAQAASYLHHLAPQTP